MPEPSRPRYVDLHTHSTASDGTDSPELLVQNAKKAGLAAIALTDHDTVEGVAAAKKEATRQGITCIGGCELGSLCPYGEVHILGLWLPNVLGELGDVLTSLRELRHTRNEAIVKKLQELHCAISYDEVLAAAGGTAVGRPHIARVLLNKGIVPSVQAAFEQFLGMNGKAYVPRTTVTPRDAVRLLKAEGATVAIAHPMLLKCPPEWLYSLVGELKEEGLDAIEAYHSKHDQQAVHRCVCLADEYGLALTGGSDYHGTAKPDIALGVGKGGLRVPLFILEKLQALRQSQGLPL